MGTDPIPARLNAMDPDRMRSYRENLEFYNGAQWETRQRRGQQRQLTLNYARVLIDKLTSYLINDVTYVVDPERSAVGEIESPEAKERARRAQEILVDAYEDNNLAVLDFDTEIDTAVLGDGCYKVTWDDKAQRVRVTAPDVQGVYVWWIPDDVQRVWRVASRYAMSAEDVAMLYGFVGQDVGRVGFAKSYVTEVWTDQEFQIWIDKSLFRADVNPYGFVPFLVFPNLRVPKQFWGVSDIEAVRESARELNRALSTLSNIVELSGNPIAVLENVEGADDIAVKPGAVWELPEKAKAYLLDLLSGGAVSFHSEYINLIYRTMHDLGEAPRTAFGDNQRSLSGVALDVELQPLMQKVKRKRLIRGGVYRKRNEMILRLAGQYQGGDYAPYRSRIVWAPVTPKDSRAETVERAGKVSAGLAAARSEMREMGVPDADREWSLVLEEKKALAAIGVRPQGTTGGGGLPGVAAV